MRALFKILGTIIGIVIVLLIAIAVIVPVYFHPNDYKEEIAAAVQEKTGRKLHIEGDIVLSVFPWIAIELGALELGNAPGFPDGEFARLERMEVGVKLLPLLRKDLEIRTVKVYGLELNLAKDKNGRTNWSDLAALQSKGAPSDDKDKDGESAQDDTKKTGLPIAILGIGGLDIQDAALRWSDAQNGQYYRLEKLTIETGAIAPESLTSTAMVLDKPIDFKVSFNVEGNKPRISGRVNTSAKFTADFAKQVFHLANLNITGKLAGESLPNGKIALDLGTDMDIDLAKQTLRLQDLRLTTGQIDANGAITVTRLLDGPAFDGTLQLEKFNPRTLLTELGQQIPETADPKTLTSASLSASIQGTTNRIRFKPLTVRLDETTLSGMLTVANFSAPAIRFDLDADAIDADRYLPPAKPEQAENIQSAQSAPATPGAVASQAARFPTDTLRALDIDGKARIGSLTIAKLKISDFALALKAKDGEIRAHPVKMKLYQGGYSGNIGIDARSDKVRISLDEKLTGVQVGPLLRDLQGDDLLSGKFRFALNVDALGATPEDLKKTLAGKADFKLEDGMIKGIDIVHTVCNAAESFLHSDGSGLDQDASEGTRFQEFTGQLPITGGRIGINNTLALKAPMLRVNGKSGAIDLGKNRLDNITFLVKPAFTCTGQGGKLLDELAGLDIPLTCNGPLEARSCLNTETLTAALIGALRGKFEEKAKEKLKEKAKDEIEKALSKKLGDKLGNELGGELGDRLGEDLGEGLGKALQGGLKGLLGK